MNPTLHEPSPNPPADSSDVEATPGLRSSGPPILWPLAALIGLTVLIEWVNLDRTVSGWFYTPVAPTVDPLLGWTLAEGWPWSLIDSIGPLLGIALGAAAGVVSLLAHLTKRWTPQRFPSTFLALCVLIGPLLIVNAGFKTTWGRPRPIMVTEFGGEEQYHSVWMPGSDSDRNRSFPSGHAAIGFVLMTPAFLFYRRRRGLYRSLLAAGLIYGSMMSVSRIVQGAHFVSDVMWSAGFVYLTAALLYRVIDPDHVLPGLTAADDETSSVVVSLPIERSIAA